MVQPMASSAGLMAVLISWHCGRKGGQCKWVARCSPSAFSMKVSVEQWVSSILNGSEEFYSAIVRSMSSTEWSNTSQVSQRERFVSY